ncbi:hypothetical protein FRC09_014207 [Ceratobasidium sp. 395]|nr:hypothetical protein FRC09_014207 [Ceratobasidium sp. 395]
MYCAHKPELTEADLEDLDGYLAHFHDLKDVFVGTEAEREVMKDLLNSPERFHGIPKLHMISHYVDCIRQLGTPDGYNTEVPERLHIDYVKLPWRASNHVNPLEQMTTYLQRREAWAFLKAYLHDTGLMPDPRFTNSEGSGEEVKDAGDDGEVEAEADGGGEGGNDGGEIWYPKPRLSIAKRATIGKKTLAYLVKKHGARDIIRSTEQFLRQLPTTRRGAFIPLSAQDRVPVWTRCRLEHKRLPFLPSTDPHTDRIRTIPQTIDREGRVQRVGAFDVVLFSPLCNNNHAEGLHRFQAGRVRAIFELPPHLKPLYEQKLAYLELFRPFSASRPYPINLHTTSHMMNSNGTQRCTAVVPLSHLRMACHLVADIHSFDIERPISSKDDLLSIHNKFFFNKYASHFLFVIMDYWRRRLNGQPR